jgi:hypothetical protein
MPTPDAPARDKVLHFDFVNTWNWTESWTELTQKGKIILPKKIYARDKYNKLYLLFGTAKNVGGFTDSPLFLRGDKVTVDAGYIYWDKDLNEQPLVDGKNMHRIITGFVANVKSKQPIELDVEDNMWKLKQLPAPNKVWPKGMSLEAILKEMLQPYNATASEPFTINVRTSTTISFDDTNLTSQNESVAQFLARLRRDWHLDSYFRGNELRCGSAVYLEDEAVVPPPVFEFQQNIHDDSDLNYMRKDDIVLSAVASNFIEDKTGTFTKDGNEKTQRRRIEILVTLANNTITTKEIPKGAKPEPNVEGQRLTLQVPWAKNVQELTDYAVAELKKHYYEGFRGSLKSFGLPHVKHGDNIQLVNKILPEQNGYYKVKGVEYSGGITGYRQKINLDFRVSL